MARSVIARLLSAIDLMFQSPVLLLSNEVDLYRQRAFTEQTLHAQNRACFGFHRDIGRAGFPDPLRPSGDKSDLRTASKILHYAVK